MTRNFYAIDYTNGHITRFEKRSVRDQWVREHNSQWQAVYGVMIPGPYAKIGSRSRELLVALSCEDTDVFEAPVL